jgi:hypothetical protein
VGDVDGRVVRGHAVVAALRGERGAGQRAAADAPVGV